MSQRQKQRTNENRARRLGTGEGISRDVALYQEAIGKVPQTA